MSLLLLNWAWETKVDGNSSTKLVLVSLADHSRDCGCSFPSTKRIAQLTGLSQRTVQSHIQKLFNLGLLSRVRNTKLRKSGFKLHPFDEKYIRPCDNSKLSKCALSVPHSVPKALRTASTISISKDIDINNRNNEPIKESALHRYKVTTGASSDREAIWRWLPEWLKVVDLTTDIGLIDNIKTPQVQSWINDIENDFEDVDILAESKKYSLWWEDKKAKKPKLAFRNWLEKARNNNAKPIGRTKKGVSHRVTGIDSETREIAERIQRQQENSK